MADLLLDVAFAASAAAVAAATAVGCPAATAQIVL